MNRRYFCGLLVLLAISEWLLFAAILMKSEIPGSDFIALYTAAKLVVTSELKHMKSV